LRPHIFRDQLPQALQARRAAHEHGTASAPSTSTKAVSESTPRSAIATGLDADRATDAFRVAHSIGQEASPSKAALALQRAMAPGVAHTLGENATWATRAVVDKYLAAGQFAEAVATVQHVLNSGHSLSPQLLTHLLTHLVRSATTASEHQMSLVSVSTAAVRVVQSFRAAGVSPGPSAWHALLQVFARFGMPPVTAPWAKKPPRSNNDSWLPRKVGVSRQRRVAGDRSAGGEHANSARDEWTQSSTLGSKHVKAGQWEAQGGMLIPRDEHSLVAGPRALLQGLGPAVLALGGGAPEPEATAAAGTLGGALEASTHMTDEEATAALLESTPATGGDPFGFGAAFAQAAAASSPQQQYGASMLPSLPVAATPRYYSPSAYPPGSSFAPSTGKPRTKSGARAARCQAAAYASPHHVNDALSFLAATWNAMGPVHTASSAALLLRCLATVPACTAAAASFVLDIAEAAGVPLNAEVQCAVVDTLPVFASPQAALALLERCVNSTGSVHSCADDAALAGAGSTSRRSALAVRWDVEPRVFGTLILRLLQQEQYMAAAEAMDAALEVGVVPPPKAFRGVAAILPALSRLQIVAPSRKQQLAPVLLALRGEAAHATVRTSEGRALLQAALVEASSELAHSPAASGGTKSTPDAVMGSVQPPGASWGITPVLEQEPPLEAALGDEGGVHLDRLGLVIRGEAAAMEADAHTDSTHVFEAVRVLLQRAAGGASAECSSANHLGSALGELSGSGGLPKTPLVCAVLRAQGAAGDAGAVQELLLLCVQAYAAGGATLPAALQGAAVGALADAGHLAQAADTAEQLIAGEMPGQHGPGAVPAAALRRVMMAVDEMGDLPAALRAYACIVAQGGAGAGAAEERALQEMCLALIRSNKPVPPSMVRGGGGDLRRFSGYFNAPPALSEQLAELQAAVLPVKTAAPAVQQYTQLHEVDLDRARALSAAFDAAKLTCSAIIQWLQATAAGVPACPVKDLSRGWEDLNALENSLEAQLAVAQAGVVEDGDAGASAELRSVLAATLELLPLVIADCPSSAAAHARRLEMSRGRRTWVKTAALRREQLAWTAAQRQRSSRSQFAQASSVAAGEAAPRLPRVLQGVAGPAAPQALLGFDLTQPRLGVWVPDAAFSKLTAGPPAVAADQDSPRFEEAVTDIPSGGVRQAWHAGSGCKDPRAVGAPHVAMLDGSRVPLARAGAIAERLAAKAKVAQHTEGDEDKAVYLDEHDALRFAQWDSRGHADSAGRARVKGVAGDELAALLAACRQIEEPRA